MKVKAKKIIFILAILLILFSIHTKVLAWDSIVQDGKSFLEQGSTETTIAGEHELQGLSSYLYNILLVAGIVIAVVVATVLGVQFMMGGAEGQAKVKEMLVPFIAGCIIVFAGFGFWKIAIQVGKKLEGATGTTETIHSTLLGTGNSCPYCKDPLSDSEIGRGRCAACGKAL